MDLQQAVKFLTDEGYVQIVKGRYVFTNKFTQAMATTLSVAVVPKLDLPRKSDGVVDWVRLYLDFILNAKVPATQEGSHGVLYETNKYSEAGMKGFRKAVETDHVSIGLLMKSTQLYYASKTGFKVTITRYMEDGLWRSDYEALLESLKNGTVEEHITEKTTPNEFTSYRRG